MKILQIFGAVVAVHLLAFIFIFASPGCSSSPRNVPTPDATLPNVSGSAGISYSSTPAETVPPADHSGYVPEGTPGRVAPTRPGSPNAAAITPAKNTGANVSPVTSYTIQKGDSLWTIAKKNHVTVAELTKANNLSSNPALRPGKKLMIPGKPIAESAPAGNGLTLPTPVVAAPAETPSHTTAEVVKHVVASGESLGIIARKYQVSVGELAAANNITDPAKIRVGQPLIIPTGKGTANRSTAKSTVKPAAPATTVKHTPTPAPAPAVEKPAADAASQFEIKPPPAGQDLDAGLKDSTSTEVPTIKVEEPKPEEATKS